MSDTLEIRFAKARGIKGFDQPQPPSFWKKISPIDSNTVREVLMGMTEDEWETFGRIDNDGNYEPSNCRWETRAEQDRNTRTMRMVNIGGVSKCVIDWCKHFSIKVATVYYRQKRGWNVVEALTTPARSRKSL